MFRYWLAAAAVAISSPALAQRGGDPLGKCLIARTSAADRAILTQWVFVAMAQSPAVRSMANISDARRDEAIASAARVLERLLTHDCRAEMIAQFKARGGEALRDSFLALGERQVSELVQDPKVATVFAGVAAHLDMVKIMAMMAEASVGR